MDIEPTRSPGPLDEILAEEGFIRSLAKKLARDDELANDVFQETLLAAMRRPRKPNAPLRSWIARVVHNRIVQTHRNRMRREKHEALLEGARAELSPADVAERDGVRAHVVRAVEEMDEPYRTAIFLRFYEDLEPREMAARLGVPVETARTRVKRAMALLRARLDREYGDDTPRWASALYLWTLPNPGGALVVADGGASAARWATGAVAAAGTAALVWLALTGGGEPRDEVAAPAARGPSAPRVAGADERAGARASDARAASAPALESIELRIVHRDDGAPVAGARVVCETADGRALVRASDAGGALSVPWPADRSLAVAIDETERTLATRARLAPEERAALAGPWTIAVEGSTELAGRAVDRFGQSLAAANALVLELDDESLPALEREPLARATADLAGRFAFDHLPRRFALLVESPERIAADVWIADLSRARSLVGLEVVLDEPAPIVGQVLDQDGNAIAGARLTLARARGDADLRSSAIAETWFRARDEIEGTSEYDGRFELARLPRGRYQLTVEKPGFATSTRNVLAPDPGVLLRLEPAVAAEFQIVDATGEPVPGAIARVRRIEVDGAGPQRRLESARADPEGRLAIQGAGASTALLLRVEAVGLATAIFGPHEVGRGAGPRRIVLDGGRELAGSVRDERGVALADRLVIARAVLARSDMRRVAVGDRAELLELARTRTDAQGEFRFAELGAVELELEVRPSERAAPAHVEPVSPRASRVELLVRSNESSGVELVGRVRAGPGGGTVADFVLSAVPERTAERASRVTVRPDPEGALDGRFRAALGSTGDWIVHVSAPGFAPFARRLVGLEPGRRSLDVELRPERTLDVRVIDARGAPVSYATIAVTDRDGRPLAVTLAAHERRSALQVGPRGEARLAGLPADEVQLHVATPLVRESQSFELDLSRGELGPQTLVLGAHDVQLARRWLALALVEGDGSRVRFGAPDANAPDWSGRLRLVVRDAAGRAQLSLSGVFEDGALRSDPNLEALYLVAGEHGEIDDGWTQELRPNWGAAFGRAFYPASSPFDALPIPAADAVLELELEGELLALELPSHAGGGARVLAVTAEAARAER